MQNQGQGIKIVKNNETRQTKIVKNLFKYKIWGGGGVKAPRKKLDLKKSRKIKKRKISCSFLMS